MNNTSSKPSAEFRFWLYDPEGNGMMYYRDAESRDAAGSAAIESDLDGEEWSEQVEYIAAGEVTHFAQTLEKKCRPEMLDSEDCGEDGDYWPCDAMWKVNYTLAQVPK